MVATFGLGGGVASFERAVKYAKERIQFGAPLVEKEGYTFKLLAQNAVRLEAARAFIEETGRRLDTDETDLQVEGSIAKYFATEAGDAMANDGIQAFGGYGYMREYEVEKIKRDVKILTIYEGTSEIQQSIISLFRMRSTVRSKGGFYGDMAQALDALPKETGGVWLANAIRLLNQIIQEARRAKINRSQYVMFLLADMMTWCEVANALCHKAAKDQDHAEYLGAAARLFARTAVEKVHSNGLRIIHGTDKKLESMAESMNGLGLEMAMEGFFRDMKIVSEALVA
jgi:alkylation response protein AidB-like acyl-CoA dehydrogenase